MSSQTSKSNETSDSTYADELLDHEYDGIREYDNPMPGWWKWLFVVTIVWAVIYFVGINMGYLPSYEDDLQRGMAEIQQMRDAHKQDSPTVDAAFLAKAVDDKGNITKGKEVFASNCASCHGDKGQGIVGPNLTDKYWIHGGKLTDIYNTVKTGVADKGMPAWGGVLSDDNVIDAVAYVHSLKGTNPPDPKEPQGEPYEGN